MEPQHWDAISSGEGKACGTGENERHRGTTTAASQLLARADSQNASQLPFIIERMFDSRQLIPGGLDTMAPGPELARVLAKVDRSCLNGHDAVIVMRARARQRAHDDAELLADMVETAYCPEGDITSPVERNPEVAEFAADEIRAALTLTRAAAEDQLGLALALCERLPRVWEALHRGDIDLRKARTIVAGTDHLPQDSARSVAKEILVSAPDLTTGQIAARLRRMCIDLDPDDAKDRYESAVAERRVVAEANPDGTADIHALQLPPDRVSAVMRRMNHLARSVKTADDPRTMDQVRADTYLDLLDGSNEAGKGGVVDIQADLNTLIGLSDKAGEIPGWGPVIADIARQVTADQVKAEWRATVTDDQGRIQWVGVTRRRPTAAMKRRIQAKDRTCVFPGCRMPATDCDIDHRIPWAEGGPTAEHNNQPLCRHDHNGKDHGWTLDCLENGDYQWTSPLGHIYTITGRPP